MSSGGAVQEAVLVLDDGTIFEGEAIGALPEGGVVTGEVVFNTSMTGYQEILTDPSYAGQIITFTSTHIGNYGVNPDDDESRRPFCRGVVVRELARRRSSWRSDDDLSSFLYGHGVPGIAGVDTRKLTRHIRDHGARPAAFGTAAESAVTQAAAEARGTDGLDLVSTVTCAQPYTTGDGPRRVVAYDFGLKRSILHQLGRWATVEVVPARTPADEVLERRPDGVFLSNGPGDPAPLTWAVANISALFDRVPVFGICLGHQLMATALGAQTFKLPFGHHGGNHPVRDLISGAVEITSQNHNYAVAEDAISGVDVTHVNLNDGVVEGMRSTEVPAFGVQFHPEAGPGPHDARHLFEQFDRMMEEHR